MMNRRQLRFLCPGLALGKEGFALIAGLTIVTGAPALAQQYGTVGSQVIVDYGVLDSLGPRPTLPGSLQSGTLVPLDRIPSGQSPVVQDYDGLSFDFGDTAPDSAPVQLHFPTAEPPQSVVLIEPPKRPTPPRSAPSPQDKAKTEAESKAPGKTEAKPKAKTEAKSESKAKTAAEAPREPAAALPLPAEKPKPAPEVTPVKEEIPAKEEIPVEKAMPVKEAVAPKETAAPKETTAPKDIATPSETGTAPAADSTGPAAIAEAKATLAPPAVRPAPLPASGGPVPLLPQAMSAGVTARPTPDPLPESVPDTAPTLTPQAEAGTTAQPPAEPMPSAKMPAGLLGVGLPEVDLPQMGRSEMEPPKPNREQPETTSASVRPTSIAPSASSEPSAAVGSTIEAGSTTKSEPDSRNRSVLAAAVPLTESVQGNRAYGGMTQGGVIKDLAGGSIRICFAEGSADLPAAAQRELKQLAEQLATDESLHVQLLAYASGSPDTESRARRVSLSRALAVRSYLMQQGVRSTRMDVRALGRNVEGEPADRVDIISQVQ